MLGEPRSSPSDPTDAPRPDTRPRPARGNGRRARSTPLPQEFSRDLQLVRLAAERPLQLGDLAAQLLLALTLLLAGEALTARPRATGGASRNTASPRSRQTSCAVRSPRNPASTISSFCCAVQLRYFLCSLHLALLLGRAAHPEPGPGKPLLGFAPPRLSGEPKNSERQRGTGERGSKTPSHLQMSNFPRVIRVLAPHTHQAIFMPLQRAQAAPRAPPPTAERPRPNTAECDCSPTSSRPPRRTPPRIRRRLSLRTLRAAARLFPLVRRRIARSLSARYIAGVTAASPGAAHQ
jgi:hypothetical protein